MAALIEPTVLADHGIAVGFVFIQGTGFRVGTKSEGDGHTRHLSIAAARRLAKSLGETTQSGELTPVIEALNDKADRLEDWLAGKGDAIPHVMASLRIEGHA